MDENIAELQAKLKSKYAAADYVDELRRLYAMAEPEHIEAGIGWYATATQMADSIAERFNTTRDQVAGVIAALSPQNRWPSNIIDATMYCHAAFDGRPQPKARTFHVNQDRGWKIANGADWRDVLQGPKVRAFAANISGDLGPVTIDLWATRAATGDMTMGSPKSLSQRRAIEEAYLQVAAEVGIHPAHFQAIVWVIVRGGA